MRVSVAWLWSVVVAAGVGCGDDAEIALLAPAKGDAGVGGASSGGDAGGGTSGCTSSADCVGSDKFCDTSNGRCVECLAASQCQVGQGCAPDGHCQGSCALDTDCTSGGAPICAPSFLVCVECNTNVDCDSGGNPICVAGECQECREDPDCEAAYPYCRSNECVECLVDAHCVPAGKTTCDPSEFQCT